MITLRELKVRLEEQLAQIDNPKLQVKILYEDLIPVKYRLHDNMTIRSHIERKLMRAVERIIAGEPIAYVTGRSYFRNYHLYVSPSVLIPRPETEELMDLVLPHITGKSLCIDIGTGSGAIALTLAKESPSTHILACDISTKALRVARKNAKVHKVTHIHFIRRDARNSKFCKDILKSITHDIEKIVIVANLPYIPSEDMNHLDRNVRDFEPHLALDGGPDGTDIIISMLEHIHQTNFPIPIEIFLEIDKANIPSIQTWSKHTLSSCTVIQDYSGHSRFIHLKLFPADTAAVLQEK